MDTRENRKIRGVFRFNRAVIPVTRFRLNRRTGCPFVISSVNFIKLTLCYPYLQGKISYRFIRRSNSTRQMSKCFPDRFVYSDLIHFRPRSIIIYCSLLLGKSKSSRFNRTLFFTRLNSRKNKFWSLVTSVDHSMAIRCKIIEQII